ncbi:hypothetical protein I3U44_07410 [Mycobacteroides abscessus subsp. bolletii]|uniref:hypothetical protein n=1 Tax=Mycobacteroides abscessus TaxID=36809 RepID=UPI0019D1FAA5|nr:hypothetical protein [Mycobacteroides abscessus]QSM90490.1 hypothetical protein I3U44_07410 [Mycobacteroides abscessus subsp. bolletii]
MTTIIEGEVVEAEVVASEMAVLPPSREEKLATMARMTPDQQVEHVTELLVHSHAGLLVAIAAQDLPGIAEAKQKAATIQEIAKQLRMANDMQLHAAEFARRANRGMGVAIRDAQARGELSGTGEGGGWNARNLPDEERIRKSPKTYLSDSHEAADTYAMTDGVSDEMFEEALTEARVEGNLSRASVARRCKTKAQSQKEVVDGDDPLIDADVAPAPVVKKTARARRTIEMLSVTTANLALSVGDIDPGEVDREQLAKEISIVFESLGTIRSFLRKVNEQ